MTEQSVLVPVNLLECLFAQTGDDKKGDWNLNAITPILNELARLTTIQQETRVPHKPVWVLSNEETPHWWHEDEHFLMGTLTKTFPEKLWKQASSELWLTSDNTWKVTRVEKSEAK